jgi:hypothetical protein
VGSEDDVVLVVVVDVLVIVVLVLEVPGFVILNTTTDHAGNVYVMVLPLVTATVVVCGSTFILLEIVLEAEDEPEIDVTVAGLATVKAKEIVAATELEPVFETLR